MSGTTNSVGMDQLEVWIEDDAGTGWEILYFRGFTPNKKDVTQDDTTSANYTQDADGDTALWVSQIKTALGMGFSFESVRRTNVDTHEQDPGQERLKAMNRKMGQAGKCWFLVVFKDTEEMMAFKGLVDLTGFGGNLTDVQQFRADLGVGGVVLELPDEDSTAVDTWAELYDDATGEPVVTPAILDALIA